MSVTYGFFNSLAGDRKYNAEQMSAIFDGIINDGVFASVGDAFKTEPGDGLQVLVYPGRAWFRSTWTLNDAIMPLDLELPDVSLSRIDAVVLEVNHSETVRANTIKVITGTPATTPKNPTLISDDFIGQLPLAYITVAPGATSVTASNIEIVVGKSECPFVTGILETVDVDFLFEKWSSDFYEWFDTLKDALDDNTATKLFGMIEGKLDKVDDKATLEEAKAGTNDSHYMTPALVKESVFPVGSILTRAQSPGKNWVACDGNTVLGPFTSGGPYDEFMDVVNDRYGYATTISSDDISYTVYTDENNMVAENNQKTKRVVLGFHTESSSGNLSILLRYWVYQRATPNDKYILYKHGANYVLNEYSMGSSAIGYGPRGTIFRCFLLDNDRVFILSTGSYYGSTWVLEIFNLFSTSTPYATVRVKAYKIGSINSTGIRLSFYFVRDNICYVFGTMTNSDSIHEPILIKYVVNNNEVSVTKLIQTTENSLNTKQLLFDNELYFIADNAIYKYNIDDEQTSLLEVIALMTNESPYYPLYMFMENGVSNLTKLNGVYYSVITANVSSTTDTLSVKGIMKDGNTFVDKSKNCLIIENSAYTHKYLYVFWHNNHLVYTLIYNNRIRFSVPSNKSVQVISMMKQNEAVDSKTYSFTTLTTYLISTAYTDCSSDNNFMILSNRSSADSSAGRILHNIYIQPGCLVPKSDMYYNPMFIKVK